MNPSSSVFVINAKQSNIKNINSEDEFLDGIFAKLRFEYKFPVDNAAIYYLFDRDAHSNNDSDFIRNLMRKLKRSRDDNDDYLNSGLLLLSYPAIESFTLSNFNNSDHKKYSGVKKEIAACLEENKMNHKDIKEKTLIKAAYEMMSTLKELDVEDINFDDFYNANIKVFDIQEGYFTEKAKFRALSFLCVALLDLGLIEIAEE